MDRKAMMLLLLLATSTCHAPPARRATWTPPSRQPASSPVTCDSRDSTCQKMEDILTGPRCVLGRERLRVDVLRTIHDVLAAEWSAEVSCDAFARQFWPLFPQLDRIRRASSRRLVALLEAHDHEAPWPAPGAFVLAPTPAVACAEAADAERARIARYDAALGTDLPADVRCVFSFLRDEAVTRNLPALEACRPGPP